MNYEKIAKIKIPEHECTLAEFFLELLSTLWVEEESFSGKRPLGDSGWQYCVYDALVREKIIKGSYDEEWDEYEYTSDEVKKGEKILLETMRYIILKK